MSTVKIKTEPTTTATAAVAVQVKLEPTLSTADIKLEQYSSDIETKVESDSDTDSEEGDIKSENGHDDGDTDLATEAPKKRQFICKHPGCSRSFNSSGNLSTHRYEHRLQTEINVHGKAYTLTRQSLNDRWPCPAPDCTSTLKTVNSLCKHIRKVHGNNLKQQQNQPQQPPAKKTRYKYRLAGVDDFYVYDICCGYHNTVGVFICHECRLVPDCLLTHLQQKHGYDEKSIDNSALPDNAVNASADSSINQHTSNPHLASAISNPYQQQHPDIVQGWLCATSNCGHCGYTVYNKSRHRRKAHQGEQMSTVPALLLRLMYNQMKSSYFLINRLDQASGAVTTRINIVNSHKRNYSHSENEGVDSQDEITEASNQKRQWKCEYPNCGQFFNSSDQLSRHRREHKLEVAITVQGNTFVLNRQFADDKWTCPIPDCETTWKTIQTIHTHILKTHSTLMKQKRDNSEDEDNQQYHKTIKRRQVTFHYLKVDDFYVCGYRCGYHTTTGLFICHECRLVPDCLLTHLQQKHGYNEKSIDNAYLPESAINENADPNTNQHTGNPHLAAAINHSSQQQHEDIIQGWLCVIYNCGYCCSTKMSKYKHQYAEHRGEQSSTIPALVLRLNYEKTRTSYFLITRWDTVTNSVESNNSASQYNSECDDEDGDELVLSDYSD